MTTAQGARHKPKGAKNSSETDKANGSAGTTATRAGSPTTEPTRAPRENTCNNTHYGQLARDVAHHGLHAGDHGKKETEGQERERGRGRGGGESTKKEIKELGRGRGRPDVIIGTSTINMHI